jgi:hypothetical protein
MGVQSNVVIFASQRSGWRFPALCTSATTLCAANRVASGWVEPKRIRLKSLTKEMPKTVEAVVDEHGQIRLLEPLKLHSSQRVLVTVLEDAPEADTRDVSETALLSGEALAEDWNRDEEDEAWKHLQPEQ